MAETASYVGQRLSLKKQPCTVRYVGPVADKQGSWLGVEWDDASRGKHDGTHDKVSYFKCRSQSPTAASFLRPKQAWDESRTFAQALKEKYISPEEANNAEIVFISGKHAEEVGLEKFAKRQAQLQGIHSLVLDRMCIRHRHRDDESDQSVASLCANITSLDLSGNLFETWDEVLTLCRLFPRLHSLTLDANRFHEAKEIKSDISLPNIRYLGLSDTLLTPSEVEAATTSFPSLETLIFAGNELSTWETGAIPTGVKTIDLSANSVTTLSSLSAILSLPQLATISLKANKINSSPHPQTQNPPPPPPLSRTLQTLDLRSNSISTWSLPNTLPTLFPSLANLLISNQPLYTTLTDATTAKPLTTEDGYTLTLARLPQLQTLNHSTVTPQERLNAETYYLAQIARQLSLAPPSQHKTILAAHPRWKALCEEYGEPVLSAPRGQDEIDPASLAARLVAVTFHRGEEVWTEDVPRSANLYALLGRVGKKVGVMPLDLKLVWETGEKDPVRGSGGEAPEWWDSSEEEEEGEGEWVAREVELGAGTGIVGSYFEGRTARVRVEVRGGGCSL